MNIEFQENIVNQLQNKLNRICNGNEEWDLENIRLISEALKINLDILIFLMNIQKEQKGEIENSEK